MRGLTGVPVVESSYSDKSYTFASMAAISAADAVAMTMTAEAPQAKEQVSAA